jgi:bifunctional non-homologous end joining protein LigD
VDLDTLKQLPPTSPGFIEPMKCLLSAELPEGDEWGYEIKFDGYRGLAVRDGAALSLLSRKQKDLSKAFPEIADALRRIRTKKFVLDGEIVAMDEEGRSAFELLQGAQEGQSAHLFYYIFDVLNWKGRDTRSLPLLERKKLLEQVLANAPSTIRLSSFLPGEPDQVSAAMKELGLEGLIAKKCDSTYESGQRSGAWVKYKWGWEQEFVIGGYTDPEGSRPFFGSLIVGYYSGEKLMYASKVGTGFNSRLLKSVYDQLQKLRRSKCPFANLPERGIGLTAGQMKFCKWVEPELVCQVRFTEWTRGNHLRQPVFLGLREDKNPNEVVREVARQ